MTSKSRKQFKREFPKTQLSANEPIKPNKLNWTEHQLKARASTKINKRNGKWWAGNENKTVGKIVFSVSLSLFLSEPLSHAQWLSVESSVTTSWLCSGCMRIEPGWRKEAIQARRWKLKIWFLIEGKKALGEYEEGDREREREGDIKRVREREEMKPPTWWLFVEEFVWPDCWRPKWWSGRLSIWTVVKWHIDKLISCNYLLLSFHIIASHQHIMLYESFTYSAVEREREREREREKWRVFSGVWWSAQPLAQ